MLTEERCKELMKQVGLPNSRSLMQAFYQLENEIMQKEYTVKRETKDYTDKKRKVKIFSRAWNRETKSSEKFLAGQGIFHQWGVDYEEFETGPVNYSIAIVEMEDGTVDGIFFDLIQFID